jgi:hypothetical protein
MLSLFCGNQLSISIKDTDAMADTNNDQAPAHSPIGVEALPEEAEVHVFPPWGTGSETLIPMVDNEDNPVHLNVCGLLHLPQSSR